MHKNQRSALWLTLALAVAALGAWGLHRYEVSQLVGPMRAASVQLSEYIELLADPGAASWKDTFQKGEATLKALDEARVHVKSAQLTLSVSPQEKALAYLLQAQQLTRNLDRNIHQRFTVDSHIADRDRHTADLSSANEYTRSWRLEAALKSSDEAVKAVDAANAALAAARQTLPLLVQTRTAAARAVSSAAVVEPARLTDLERYLGKK